MASSTQVLELAPLIAHSPVAGISWPEVLDDFSTFQEGATNLPRASAIASFQATPLLVQIKLQQLTQLANCCAFHGSNQTISTVGEYIRQKPHQTSGSLASRFEETDEALLSVTNFGTYSRSEVETLGGVFLMFAR